MTKKSLSKNDPGFFAELWQQAKLVFQLFLDRDVPIYLKILPVAAIAYLLFPVDFLPDIVPGLGQIDDLTILLLGAKIFIEMAPQDVVNRYLGRISSSSKAQEKSADAAGSEPNDDVIEGIVIEDTDDTGAA